MIVSIKKLLLPIHHFSTSVVAEIIRRQPASPEKTRFVWQLAVGPALARVTTAELAAGALVVRANDARWMQEIDRARDVILARVQHLIGPDKVARLELQAKSVEPHQ
jgi:Dna[CI] antecedent DciA-like protein